MTHLDYISKTVQLLKHFELENIELFELEIISFQTVDIDYEEERDFQRWSNPSIFYW